jgi:polar amino acid transport system substrate-binding protein
MNNQRAMSKNNYMPASPTVPSVGQEASTSQPKLSVSISRRSFIRRVIPALAVSALAGAVFFCSVSTSAAQAQEFKILGEDAWYPYSGMEEGRLQGLTVDIVNAAFAAIGSRVTIVSTPYDRAMEQVRSGEAVACFNTPREPGVDPFFLWPQRKLFTARAFYFARKDFGRKISSVEDTRGLRVGLVQGYGYDPAVDNDKTFMVKEYTASDATNLKKLVAGRLDLAIVFELPSKILLKKLALENKVEVVGETRSAECYMAFSQKHPDAQRCLELFNQGFEAIFKSGEYQRIMDSWLGRVN